MGTYMLLKWYCCHYVWSLLLLCIVSDARHTSHPTQCERTSIPSCRSTVNATSLPNIYGHTSQTRVQDVIQPLLDSLSTSCPLFTQFMCSVFLPPCLEDGQSGAQTLIVPCRIRCDAAYAECRDVLNKNEMAWPPELDCGSFPTEKCYTINEHGNAVFVEKSLQANPIAVNLHNLNPASLAPIESELGDNDLYNVEVVSMTINDIPQRRYDVIDLGDPDFFQGWADVQGTGAANDYCRVIGRGKRKFLSCALAGSGGQDHRYVSKLGFKPGHHNTWFMRDVDNDKRDDYCRCIGNPENSKIYCMKAGESGFYGSSVQGGSQFTFELPGSSGCYNKHLNPFHGA